MKKKILVSSVIIIVIAVALYFALFNKKEVETTAFGRTLGISEKNALKDSIVVELWNIRQGELDNPKKLAINPDSASSDLNKMSSEELLTIQEMVEVYKGSYGKNREPNKKQNGTIERFKAILDRYGIKNDNGLQLLSST